MKKLVLLFFISLMKLFSQDDNLTVKGFGTIGAVYNENKDYIFRNNTLKNDGSSGNLDYFTDSIFGLHTTYNLNQSISFNVQVIDQEDYYGDNEAKIDSAYFKYHSDNNTILKIGKIILPYYKNSDNRNIGYSKLMIREPIEVYGQVPFYTYNGIELTYSNVIDRYFYTLQANYGRENTFIPMHSGNGALDVDINDMKAINFTFGTDLAEIRATYMYGNTTAVNNSLEKLFSSLRAVRLNKIADEYEYKNKSSEYFGLGFFSNYNDFTFESEYAVRKVDSFYADMHGYYVTLGYNIKDITPYISFSKSIMDDKPITISTGIPAIDYGFNNLLAVQNLSQSTQSIGFKYLINENLDFKLQYQRIIPEGGAYGSFYLSDTYPNSKLNVYSFAFNFIF